MELCFLANKQKHEVDVVVVKDGRPDCLIEVKAATDTPSPSLKYFAAFGAAISSARRASRRHGGRRGPP